MMSELHYPAVRLFVDGIWRDGAQERTQPVRDPATGSIVGTVAMAEVEDLDQAVAAAVRGFAIWRNRSPYERSKVLRTAAAILRERADETARLLTLEQGKPLEEARLETMAAADIIEWFAEEGRRAYGRVIPGRIPGVTQLVLKEPVGPVAAFTPWNFPINQTVRKTAAALAAGCSIVVKGPEETPASCAALIAAFADAGLPPGVLNLVYGVPAEISAHLVPHPDIRKISFTGSTAVGKRIAALAGQHMKRVTMELGGHAPVIVCEDAAVEHAVRTMAGSKFRNAGQACIAPTRFLVHRQVFDPFLEGFVAAARGLRVGHGMEAGVTMGPLANERRVEAMEALISDAVRRGARIETGGKRIGNTGFFFEPTVLTGVPPDARIANEEPFGPVAVISRFEVIEEAVGEANRLPYGLAAYVYTASAGRASHLASAVESGMVSVNHYGLALPEVPFGGVKDSGYGSEGGSEALDAYLNTKFVSQIGI